MLKSPDSNLRLGVENPELEAEKGRVLDSIEREDEKRYSNDPTDLGVLDIHINPPKGRAETIVEEGTVMAFVDALNEELKKGIPWLSVEYYKGNQIRVCPAIPGLYGKGVGYSSIVELDFLDKKSGCFPREKAENVNFVFRVRNLDIWDALADVAKLNSESYKANLAVVIDKFRFAADLERISAEKIGPRVANDIARRVEWLDRFARRGLRDLAAAFAFKCEEVWTGNKHKKAS